MLDELKALKSRAAVLFRLYSVFKTEDWLWRWFEAEMHVLKHEGLVDVHASVFVGRDTETAGTMLTMANLLQMRRQGKLTPVDVH
jgi:hypothetical protein